MKSKYSVPLALFILGMLIVIVGAYIRLLKWEYANVFLVIGMMCEAAGLILLIRILLKNLKNK
ncbi:hypothetical protein [Flavobacterium sp.]|uniref:GldL-related protein n=1 Tax=Flavobacterium sp. TaxID=239 RepID=UPI003527E01B